MKPIISCVGLTKTYSNGDIQTTVLKNVSFDVHQGEFVAISGPSGSGKSTLMHILGALDIPTSGTYVLDGKDVSKLSDDELAEIRNKRIGFVFQAFNLLKRATVLHNVEMPLMYANIPHEKRIVIAKKALKDSGIEEESHYSKNPNQLSGGQMQRVAIARSLVNNPTILLADEPTGNLDQKTGQIVLNTFQNLNRQGRTIILITHDQYVANHADRIIQIRDGQITEDKPTNTH